MSWLAVAITVSTASTLFAGVQQRNAQKAQTKQIEMAQRANTSAVEQAKKDKQYETDMAVYQQERQNKRDVASAVAGQANSGIAGITASRQVDNVLFQNILDVNYIKTQGENSLIGITNQGFNQDSQLQAQKNTSKINTPSYLEIGISSGVAGLKTYASGKS